MRVAFVLSSLLLLPFVFNYVYAQEPIVMEQVTSNGMVKVQLFWPEVLPDQLYNIELRFLNPQNNEPITDRIVYDVTVVQNEAHIEFYEGKLTEDDKVLFEVVFPEEGTGPAQVIVVITAMGIGSTSTEMNERVMFNVQVVQEFPAIVVIVIAVSMMIILVAKLSRNVVVKTRNF